MNVDEVLDTMTAKLGGAQELAALIGVTYEADKEYSKHYDAAV